MTNERMTDLTPAENYAVASHILTDVSDAISVYGAAPEMVLRDIARAQVYATLATAGSRPDDKAIRETLWDALRGKGVTPNPEALQAAAEAVGRLL